MNEKLYYDESSPYMLRRKVECRTGKGIGRVMASVGEAGGKKMAEDTRSLAIEELNSLGEEYTDRHNQKGSK